MAHPDLDQLLDVLLPFAQKCLVERGEFYPFGASLSRTGELVLQAAHAGDDPPPAQEALETLEGILRTQATGGEIRAAGLCVAVRTQPPGQTNKIDAIHVGLEHQTGESVSVFLPYQKRWLRKPRFGELYATTREARFWGSSQDLSLPG
jgi:hypothetical protein